MPEPLVLRIGDLRSALIRALTATEQALGQEVIIEDDCYWNLPVDAAFDMARVPESLTVGQLSDDLLTVHDADPTAPGLRAEGGIQSADQAQPFVPHLVTTWLDGMSAPAARRLWP